MKYIVATDYDGTLNQSEGITPATVEAINKFRASGNYFCIVTGRDYEEGYKTFKAQKLFPFDFILTNNGSAAYDADGTLLFCEKIKGDVPWRDSKLAKELMLRILCLTSNTCGMAFERSRMKFHPEYPSGTIMDGIEFSSTALLDDVGDFVSANAWCDSYERTAEVADVLRQEFGEYLNPVQNGICIDITAVGTDKATGVGRLAALLNVNRDNIWTAGDNYNDMSMLSMYHGCAMTSGLDGAKTVSEYVCDSVADVIELVFENNLKKKPL